VINPLWAWRRKGMSEQECWVHCYGGPRHIKVLRDESPDVAMPQIRKFFERRLNRRERKAA
jgi:hypothetical protein